VNDFFTWLGFHLVFFLLVTLPALLLLGWYLDADLLAIAFGGLIGLSIVIVVGGLSGWWR
jgi:uncharacterized membrane protein